MHAIIDHTEDITLDVESNEFTTLDTVRRGLVYLFLNVRNAERPHVELANKLNFTSFGAFSGEERNERYLITSFFHWFAISLCNYARLVGYIRVLTKDGFTRNDLQDKVRQKLLAKAITAYVNGVPELAPVIRWRNKVAGHFAITEPIEKDNIATLDMSVMHPLSLENGIYHVGGMTLFKRNSTGEHTSDIPTWSITKIFDSLGPRYWPNLVQGTPSAEEIPTES